MGTAAVAPRHARLLTAGGRPLFCAQHGYHLGQFRIPDEKMMPCKSVVPLCPQSPWDGCVVVLMAWCCYACRDGLTFLVALGLADETDIRVPFFARGPGIAPNTVIDELISNIDIGPTLCELAGIPVPNIMDGRSLVPLLKGGDADLLSSRPWRTHFMTEFAEGGFQQWGTNGMWDTDPANPVVDLSVLPPWGINCSHRQDCPANKCDVASDCPKAMRYDYQYDDPTYNWRALRVINKTDDFTFVQIGRAHV